MKKVLLKLLILVGLTVSLTARADVNTSLGSGSVCANEEIQIPIKVSDLNNVAAISLVLNYDSQKLSYYGYTGAHSSIAGPNCCVNATSDKIYVSWFSLTPVSFENDTLLMIRFQGTVNSGNAALQWDTQNCEYANVNGNPINSTYTNGSVTVWALPSVTQHPSNLTLEEGQTALFNVSATGYAITYQWQVKPSGGSWSNLSNSSIYNNVTTSQLRINNVPMSMNGHQYRCLVNGGCANTSSNTATLTVGEYVPPIVTTIGSVNACPSTEFAVPVTVTNCNNVGSLSIAFNYNAEKMTYVGYQNFNSSMNLAGQCAVNGSNGVVYITWASSGSAVSIGNGKLVDILFESQSGYYSLNWNGSSIEYTTISGSVLPTSYASGSANVYNAPSVTSQPQDRSIYEGQSTTFSVGASGQGLSYTWQVCTSGSTWNNCVNGTHYSNVSSSTLTINNATVAMSGYSYRCVVCGTCAPCAYSQAAKLSVDYVVGTSVESVSSCPNETFTTNVNVTNFNNVGSFSLALDYNPSVLTFEGVTNVNDNLGSDVVANANNGTVYLVWHSDGGGVSIGNGTLLKLQFTGVTGQCYLNWNTANCEYSTGNGTPISMTFNNAYVTIYPSTMVVLSPQNQNVYAGQNAVFCTSATGNGLGYQWQEKASGESSWINLTNGDSYSNVTSTTLTVNHVTMDMSGNRYRCRVTSNCGTVNSNSALLTVKTTQPVVTAEQVEQACTGIVSQDIQVDYFNNVGAFSLVLDYDTNYLRYRGYDGLNNALQSNCFVLNQTMGRIYITYASGNAINIGSGTLFTLNFESSGGSSTNVWQTSSCEVADIDGNVFETNYNNGVIHVLASCEFSDVDIDYFWYDEIIALCGKGIVTGYNCKVNPTRNLKRSELAKMLFIALYGSPNASVVTDGFPSPFLDMQKTNTYYYKYAKALSYLEYRDGVSVFDRDKMNFNPEGTIKRSHFVKAMLETFNIPPLFQDTVIFQDVPVEMDLHGYINRAYKMGVFVDVDPDDHNKRFHPNALITRGDAMGYLRWFLLILEANNLKPTPNNSQNIMQSDYFIPGNYTPYNFTAVLGQEMGNFNHTSKSSFNIPARGFPLQFEHTYNSFLTELPRQIFATDPLGQGWTHNYNSYIINTDEVLDDYGHPLVEPCLIVFWPDGTTHVYDNENAPTHPKPITKGVYSIMTKASNTQYTVKMKDQSVYTFTKITGSADDAPYMLTRMEDRHGNATTLTYEIGVGGLPRIYRVYDDSGRHLDFTYHNGNNHLKSVSDPINRSVSFVVEEDNLTSYINAKGDSTHYYYDTLTHYNHLLDSIRLPKGNVITNTYEQRKLTSTKYNNGSPTTIQHNANYVANANVFYSSTVTEMIDGHSVSANHQFDRDGNETHISSGNSEDVTKTFDEKDPTLLKSMTNNKTGLNIQFEYDSIGNLTKMTKQAGTIVVVRQFEYNEQNDVVKQIDAMGNETSFLFEEGNVVQTTDALGNQIHFDYNEYGQLVSFVDAVGNQVNYGFDEYGNRNFVRIPMMNKNAYMVYDEVSRMIKVVDFNGNSKNYGYDALDALLVEKDAMGDSTLYVYDKNGNLTAIRNAAGDSTLFTYDFNSDVLLSMSFQGISKHYCYNEDGTLHTLTTPNGDVFTMVYDNEGRITDFGYASLSYDNTGKIHSVTKDGKSIVYTYDAFDRIISESYAGRTVQYNYDVNDNLIQIIYPGNHVVTYEYNELNQMSSVIDWNGNTTTYSYSANGLLDGFVYPNQVQNSFVYDLSWNITDMGSKRSDGSDIVNYHFEMDANGNCLSAIALEQFIDMPLVNLPNVSYNFNAANRLLWDATNEYQYDYNGNMISKGNAAYSYDVMNKLTSYTGNCNCFYTYDGNGQRRSASRNGEYTEYVLDQDGNVLAEFESNGDVRYYYVYGQGLISRIRPNNTTNYYIYDSRGNVAAMTDDTEEANVTHKYQYDDFGNIIQLQESDINLFRFGGKRGVTYEDSCLYYMHARYYDPTIGRFLSEDPKWNQNLYSYSNNNPIVLMDYDGEEYEMVFNLVMQNYGQKVQTSVLVAVEKTFPGITKVVSNGASFLQFLTCFATLYNQVHSWVGWTDEENEALSNCMDIAGLGPILAMFDNHMKDYTVRGPKAVNSFLDAYFSGELNERFYRTMDKLWDWMAHTAAPAIGKEAKADYQYFEREIKKMIQKNNNVKKYISNFKAAFKET